MLRCECFVEIKHSRIFLFQIVKMLLDHADMLASELEKTSVVTVISESSRTRNGSSNQLKNFWVAAGPKKNAENESVSKSRVASTISDETLLRLERRETATSFCVPLEKPKSKFQLQVC